MSTPAWLTRLELAVASITAADLSRHPQPEPGLPARQSAVLMTFSETEDGPGLLLIKRADDLRHHAGQVAFPGGASDPGDLDAAATALREAEEEVGLDPGSVQVLASLPTLFLPPSRFLVTPVLAWWVTPHPVRPVDTGEVADVAVLPVLELADPANRFIVRHPSGWLGPGFEVRGWFVWGFTAGLVDRLLDLGGWAQPWDDTRRRSLPA